MELKPGYKQTVVGVIPEDWAVPTLGDLIDSSRSIRYGIVQPGRFDPRGRYMVRGQDYSDGWANSSTLYRVSPAVEERYANARIRTGDILITIVGASTGKVAIVPSWLHDANLTQTTARVAINSAKASGPYCGHILSSWYGARQVQSYIKGGAQPGLNCGDIEKFLIPLPPSGAEQRDIAAALGDVDALLSGLDQLLIKKRDLKQAAMQHLLTGKTRLPGFSGEWEVKRLGDIFQFLTTANNPRSDLSDMGEVGYIHYGDIHTTSSLFLDCAEVKLPRIAATKVSSATPAEEGDLVLADASEDTAGIGKSLEIRNLSGRRVVAGLHTFLLRGDKNLIGEGFRGYIQCFSSVRTALLRFATGISVYGVSKRSVRSIEVTLPSVDEQRAIAAILSDMDAEIAALEKRRDKTRALKQGMMQELLTGRIRLV